MTSAVPSPLARQLGRAEVTAAGAALSTSLHQEPGGSLLEVTLPPDRTSASRALPATEASRRNALRLLATAVDGSTAIADAIGDPDAGLTIAHPDGSQAHTAVAGVSGAAFSPVGGWLAVTDASGRLWRVEADTGRARQIADGLYGAAIAFAPDGSLLLVTLSSAGAPFQSGLVRLNPETGRDQTLYAQPGFVFSARPLADGSVAAVVHPFGGGVAVVRIAMDGTTKLATLAPTAIDVTIDDDASRIAYGIAGDGIYLVDRTKSSVRRLGDGELPRIAPDGGSVLALRDATSVLLGLDGRDEASFAAEAVAWMPCAGRCSS